MVSASNWQAVIRPGVNTRGRCKTDIFAMKIEGHRLTLLNRIGAILHAHWHVSYIQSTRMSHRTLHHKSYTCTWWLHTLVQEQRVKERRKRRRKAPPPPTPSFTTSTASPSWILTSPPTKMPRLSYCHDVTFRFGAIITRRSRMLARDASFFSVIKDSIAS